MNLFLSPYYELKGLLSGDLTSVFRMNTRFLSQLAWIQRIDDIKKILICSESRLCIFKFLEITLNCKKYHFKYIDLLYLIVVHWTNDSNSRPDYRILALRIRILDLSQLIYILFWKNWYISENLGLSSGSRLQHCLIKSKISFVQAPDAKGFDGVKWKPSEWNQCWRFSMICWSVRSDKGAPSRHNENNSHMVIPKAHTSLFVDQRR